MNQTRSSTLFFPRFRAAVAPRLAPPLAAALLLFSCAGCLSTSVQVRPGGEEGKAGILVRVFADQDSAKAGQPNAAGTLVELFRLDKDGGEVFLQRSLAGEWGVDGLPPGRYRLKVPAVIDAGGNIRETRSGDRETDIKVKSGQTAEVRIILKKTPTGLIVAASITVVVLVVALAILLSEKSGSPPQIPLPPPKLLIPPAPLGFRPVVASAEIWIPVPVGGPPPERSAPPRVTSVIPEPGSVVSQRRVKPTLTLSQPIDEAKLGRDTILMLGSASGIIPGVAVYRQGLLQFEPDRDLVPGETVTVTVRARGVVNPGGGRLEADFSWSFRAAGRGEPSRE